MGTNRSVYHKSLIWLRLKAALALIVLFPILALNAAEISSKQAAIAAGNWMKRNPSPLNSQVGQAVLETKTYNDDSDTPLFHVVRFAEGGFVFTSADDGILPIIAFSSDDDLIVDPGNPFWVMLNRDMPQRLVQSKKLAGQPQMQSAVTTSSTTLAQRQAIGKLTYDVGVASYMKYASSSGAYESNLARAFTDRFGYDSACLIYNIFPEHDGEIISGRVLDTSGNPVSGITVTAVDETSGTTLPSVTSDANGIYSVLVPEPSSPSTHSYNVTATSGSLIDEQSTTVSASYTEGGVTEMDTHAVTILDIPPITLPYSENFESDMGSWLPSTGNDGDWQTHTGATSSTGTGPESASDESYYAYVEASTSGTGYVGYPDKTAAMEASFDFSGMFSIELSFDYHMYGSEMGSLYIDVYDGTWHEGIWSRTGQQQTSSSAAWLGAVVDLSAYAGNSSVLIRFRGVTSTSWISDMAVDNIALSGQVVVAFDNWALNEGIPEGLRGENDTPAYDGIANLLKYACGLSSMQAYSSSNLLAITESDSSSFAVRYFKSKNTVDVTLQPIWASSLSGSWSTTNITDVLVNDGIDIEERKASIPLDESGFIRLRATMTPVSKGLEF